ncbi:PREDICTED: transcription factor 25 [Ceratosolen solmsi marchali]|uniref:Transcription factor 25 n=1 Tax=Ceratosolen solmsi marchali TaxID=326594 RepID=A0AAJ6YHI9_9HYME|nr:PREDICTED: transcription factor 25 [Ceratosolen solmsi marchali]
MSTRYMKKLFGNDIDKEQNKELEDEINDLHIEREIKKSFNVFDLLNENCENDIEDTDEVKIGEQEQNCNKMSKSKKKKKTRQKHAYEIDKEIDKEMNKQLMESRLSAGLSSSQIITKKRRLTREILMVECKVYVYPKIFQNKLKTRPHNKYLRKTWLVSAHEKNIDVASRSGLSMYVTESISFPTRLHFNYKYNHSYNQIQIQFYQAVVSSDIQTIFNIAHAHPYHVDSLLHCANFYKITYNLAMSAKFIEQALFYLEYAFHPKFMKNYLMDYNRKENRALFIALFKRLILVGDLSFYRTSLELCKLLMLLDSDDPLAVSLMIDFYAIRSKEYEWFCEFCDSTYLTRNLNIIYSLSLAYFYLGKYETANEYLQKALFTYPTVLIPLLEACNQRIDSKIISHKFFCERPYGITMKLQEIYIARCSSLWKKAETLRWLVKQTEIILNEINANDGPTLIKQRGIKRDAYHLSFKSVLRHVVLSDLKDVTVTAQELQSGDTIYPHDPLPPRDDT